jgi:uncharacterized protein
MLATRLADIAQALRHVPRRSDWRRTALELAWAVPVLLVVACFGGLIRWVEPPDATGFWRLAAVLFIAPALGEELLFRGLLIPRRSPDIRSILLSTAAFMLWHPLQAWTIGPPWAAAFLDPWFLAAVAVLGLALGRIYAATGSLWPCVATHWLVVLNWKTFLGGPF